MANSTNGAGSASNGTFSISPGAASIDTNCTGCNATNASGSAVEQLSATLNSGGAADVTWSLPSGGTYGSITASGQYTPPAYLTADSLKVTITAKLASNPSVTASANLAVTPGFLQPLTPENAAVAGGGAVTITGYIAEVGGTTGINFAVSSSASGSSGGEGSLGAPSCVRNAGAGAFTYCSVTYTAPSTVSIPSDTYVVATVGASSSKSSAVVLLNNASGGVDSNPANHQLQLSTPIDLGASGGNNNDYDTQGSQIIDCCSGTLGSLIQDTSGKQYLLSNNHVLARSDQAKAGDEIIQPGLIDDNCSPFGDGGTEIPVGTLTAFVPIKSSATDVDAAIAKVESNAVNSSGAILELGARQPNGTLAAAPPGVSSSGGKGETASLNMVVAKSGRTTGLTCGQISAFITRISVDYYTDCAETKPYYTKNYTNQLGIAGNQFSDAGDSGSLVVDTSDAEPVGLFFAGGVDNSGQSEGVASPAPEVLSELGAQENTSFKFVGATDHPVSCLNYGDGAVAAAQARTLSAIQIDRGQQALMQARALVNPSTGILGVATGKSSDHAGEAAVIVYVDPNLNVAVPATVNRLRTVVIPASPQAVAAGTAPQTPSAAGPLPALSAGVLNQAMNISRQVAPDLMRQNPAFFGVGVGQSLDDPREAALVLYVDREKVPATLPATIDGLRTRYVIMERLHVTRAYARGVQRRSRCVAQPASRPAPVFDLRNIDMPSPSSFE